MFGISDVREIGLRQARCCFGFCQSLWCPGHLKLADDKDPSIEYVAAGGHTHLYFSTEGVDELATTLEAQGVEFHTAIHDTRYGSREFTIRDNQGHILCFASHHG